MNEKLIAALRHNTAMDAMSKRHRHTDLMAADALDAADAKMHEQDLRIADLVAHLNAEQAKVAHLVEEIEQLKAENCNIRENSVSHEMYMQVSEELDAAIADMTVANCHKCKKFRKECSPMRDEVEDSCCKAFEWRGRKERNDGTTDKKN